MAIEHKSRHEGIDKQALRDSRNALVPLHGGMGTGWDTAWASLYLHSDEARFVTGVALPVDGGQSCMVGGLMPVAHA
jgi:NAD(P)-dependent dehydrogenase (short-subunit alcohol dehydrogenase family)